MVPVNVSLRRAEGNNARHAGHLPDAVLSATPDSILLVCHGATWERQDLLVKLDGDAWARSHGRQYLGGRNVPGAWARP
jgi:hypothetical protein